jgi:GTP-binding protein
MQWYNSSLEKAYIMNARFVCSAAHYNQVPAEGGDEFCLMGRSNVGKSSFINHVFGNRDLARVAKKPGKTTLANFFEVSDGTVWVDLPGYGFASAPKGEKVRWDRLIEEYCEKREILRGCVWLLDIRHPGLPVDLLAHRWFSSRRIPMFPVLTKCDKVTRQEGAALLKEFMESFGFPEEPVMYTTTRQACKEEFWMRFGKWQSGLV